MQRGRFITLEGGDGTGKSTQAGLLAGRLGECGHRVVVTREPGGSPFAEHLRRVLLRQGGDTTSRLAEALVFYAARADHLATTIVPALDRGEWVICDRFADSTRAYQGAAGGLDEGALDTLEGLVVAGHWPDLTIILDLAPEIAHERRRRRATADGAASGRDDPFESEGLAFHEKLRSAFLEIAAADPARCHVVDAGLSERQVSEAIWEHLCRELAP